MNASTRVAKSVALVLAVTSAGCQPPPTGCTDLSSLTTDANGNGFPDVEPPEGVPFDESSTLRVVLNNTLTKTDLAPLAIAAGVNETLVNLADFLVTVRFHVGYDNGTEQTICQTEVLGPFDIAFEAACPASADIEVEIAALLPITNTPIDLVPIGIALDSLNYECGQTVQVSTDSGLVSTLIASLVPRR